jgi:hypothetical protein
MQGITPAPIILKKKTAETPQQCPEMLEVEFLSENNTRQLSKQNDHVDQPLIR